MPDRTLRGFIAGFLLSFLAISAYYSHINGLVNLGQRAEKTKAGSPRASIIQENVNSDKNNRPSEAEHRANEEANWRTQNIIAVFQILFGIATLLASIVAVIIAIRAYYATLAAAAAAKTQADEAKRQADAAIESFINNDRPLLVTHVATEKIERGLVIPSFSLQNIGTRPASIDIVFMQINTDGSREIPVGNPWKNDCGTFFGPFIVKAGEVASISVDPKEEVFSQAKKTNQFFYGTVIYENPANGTLWRIKYSYVYVASSQSWVSQGSILELTEHVRIDRAGKAIQNPFQGM